MTDSVTTVVSELFVCTAVCRCDGPSPDFIHQMNVIHRGRYLLVAGQDLHDFNGNAFKKHAGDPRVPEIMKSGIGDFQRVPRVINC